ncbi:MAG TPA: cytochrome P450 [Gemmataceae bacterium]|nr:cytochrome P450 [Gemmataceae bacterium]
MQAAYPPGPRDRFLGITLHHFLQADPLGFAVQVAREYGDFAFVRIGWVRLYFVNRPDLIREVLTTRVKSFRKLGRQMRALRKMEGEGLVVSDGETWARHRPVVQGSFHARHLARYAQIVVEHTLRRLKGWTSGEPFDLAAEMNELALEIIARVVFGVDLAEQAEQLRDAVHVARSAMQREIGSPLPLPDWLPTPGKIRQRRALRTLDGLIWDLIHQRRAGAERDDMLGQMLSAAGKMDVASPITDAEIRDEAATLFVAGHDTTSASLAWLWYALSQNPEVERRVVAEVEAALGGRTPTFEDLPKLKYLETTVKETMRFYPASAFLFGREALEDVELGGFTLRRGAWVFISPYIVQHDAAVFPDPERFDPERFSPSRMQEIPPYAFLPFGGGPRICIGNAFAVMEMVLVAATILQQFQAQLDQPPPEIEMEVVMRPRGGLRMRATPRPATPAVAA